MYSPQIITYLSVLLFVISCTKNSDSKDTKVRKETIVYADPAYVALAQELGQVYESVNDSVNIKVVSMPENEAIEKFIQDSIQLVFTSRNIDTAEALYLNSKNKNGKGYLVAQDALAFIINENENDSVYTQSEIKQTFIINRKNKKIVFNENNSSTLNYMNQYLRPASLTSEATATRSSEDLIDYIAQNKNSIGIIGSNFFSNLDDSTANIIYSKVKLVGISVDGGVYYPFQADISAHKYPYIRNIYVLNNEHYYGKYSGFKNFILSPRGQRLILKSGLLPIQMPNRLLNFVKKREQ